MSCRGACEAQENVMGSRDVFLNQPLLWVEVITVPRCREVFYWLLLTFPVTCTLVIS